MADPWSFGWTQLIALTQLAAAIIIAILGFQSFSKWRREKIEERRMDVAVEALSLAYEADSIFESIRAAFASGGEMADLSTRFGVPPNENGQNKFYRIVLARMQREADFFVRLNKLQPRFMAIFGSDKSSIFRKAFEARANIAIAAQMLMDHKESAGDEKEFWLQLKADVVPYFGKQTKEGDRVGKLISEFKADIEALCLPVIAHKIS